MRTFIALDLNSKDVKDAITSLQTKINSAGADVKLVAVNNIHFTLRFLGEVSHDQLHEIKDRLQGIKADRFSSQFVGMGAFPTLERISVIWIGVDENSGTIMRTIASQINRSLSGVGLREDRRGFEPHLTIARVRSGRNRDALVTLIKSNRDNSCGSDTFAEFKLKRSDLTPQGPIYTDIASFALD